MTTTLSQWHAAHWVAPQWVGDGTSPGPGPIPPPELFGLGERLLRQVRVRRQETLGLTDRFTSLILAASTVDVWMVGRTEALALAEILAARVRKRKGKPLRLVPEAVSFTLLPEEGDLV
jgi:hypothetical protein